MNVKQLAERLEVRVQQLEFELQMPCKNCKRTGGSEDSKECGWKDVEGGCEVIVAVKVQQ